MSAKQRKYFLLILLIIFVFSLNYKTLDGFLIKNFQNKNEVLVQRIIDGDTIIANNKSIRLLGINSPEKGEKYSMQAKEFLEKQTLNKTIILQQRGTDLYYRTLAYLFIGNKNINLEIVKNGYANFYFPQAKDSYYLDFKNAWQNCVANNLNYCEKSENICAACISLKNFDYKNEIITLENKCNFDCDLTGWDIKDEGRKHFTFPKFNLKKEKEVHVIVSKTQKENTNEKLFWFRNDYVWTDSGDTMFLRDPDGKLAIWQNY